MLATTDDACFYIPWIKKKKRTLLWHQRCYNQPGSEVDAIRIFSNTLVLNTFDMYGSLAKRNLPSPFALRFYLASLISTSDGREARGH